MAKGTILDRLAGAMETLGKREGKALTPRQRVAAAQRWNSLADIGESRLDEYRDTFGRDFLARDRRHAVKNGLDNADYGDELWGLMDLGLAGKHGQRPNNPFLSDNIDKYAEQSDFLEWCRYNRVEPNGQALKQFRWETYRMPIVRQPFLVRNKRAYYDDGRFLSESPMLMMAPDAEVLRNYMANHGFARPVLPSEVDVDVYYCPYLPGTEKLMRLPGDPRNNYFERYRTPSFDYGDYSSAFSEEDYWLLREMRREAEAKRRAREEYLNGDWYQD